MSNIGTIRDAITGSTATINPSGQIHVTQYQPDGTPGSRILSASGTPEIQIYASDPISTVLEDYNGNKIDSEPDHLGKYHLAVTSNQDVNADDNNSSAVNLAAGATFTGTATSTLGVVGLQWSLYATENCTVYIDQSPDGTNWDVTYSFNYIASKGGAGETVQATQSYWRIRVTNDGALTTTAFRLQGVLCPIATPLPSSLSGDSRLKTETTITGKQNTGRHVFVSPLGGLTTLETVRLVGTSFDGTTKDTNFWIETAPGTGTVNGGSVTQNGTEIVLATNTTSNGAATYQSKQRARFVVSRPLKFFGFFAMATDPQADNLRRIGAYDGVSGVSGNGFFFQVNGTTFSIGTRKGGTDTLINNGSFNGNMGSTVQLEADERYYKAEIEYGAFGVSWYLDDVLLHEIGREHWVNTFTLPVSMECVNSNGNITNNIMDCTGAVIIGQGQLQTASTSYYHAYGSTAGVTLKYGAGVVHTIIFGGAANNAVVTISDSTSAATPVLWRYDATGALSVPVSVDMGGLSFSNGLRLTVTNSASCTIVYE